MQWMDGAKLPTRLLLEWFQIVDTDSHTLKIHATALTFKSSRNVKKSLPSRSENIRP